ncbi:hypothetical protein F5887DRAFT_119308 [Amanita rubescens]|nr:hypothetical protein F5887DRAFT_119308 [Amanita rubescens]
MHCLYLAMGQNICAALIALTLPSISSRTMALNLHFFGVGYTSVVREDGYRDTGGDELACASGRMTVIAEFQPFEPVADIANVHFPDV